MQKRLALPDQCAWVNYVRCHDDIGWTFSDDDAAELWINGFDHRQFLNEFYRGRFPGSFARGLPFQENPKTGDSRISGTCASLAGLEKAIAIETGKEVDLAIKRIVLIHGIIMTIGGIPLIYLGDELGTLNDYHYLEDKSKAHDSRWVHRPKFDSKKSDNRTKKNTIEGKIYKDFLRLIQIRKNNSVFRNLNTEILDIDNPHVFGYIRKNNSDYIIALANFSEKPQEVVTELILSKTNKQLVDIESEQILNRKIILLAPYDLRFIRVQ
jgi:hypothetical protein